MNEQPLISICITTYNRRDMLKKTLDSAINQTYKNIEILIGDNHSEDGTEELCREYSQKDPRIQYYRHEKNLGMTENANFVFKKAGGEYFIALCDDDWLDLDYVEQLLFEAFKHPNYSLILSSIWFYDINYNLDRKFKPTYLAYDSPAKRIEKYIKKNYTNAILEGLWKTDVLKNLYEKEGVFQHYRVYEDWTLTIKFLAAGKCKMTDATHYNKTNAGNSTIGMKSGEDFWPTAILKEEKNPIDYVALLLGNNIINDNFFGLYLTEEERVQIRRTVIKSYLITTNKTYFANIKKPIIYLKRLLGYMYRNPFFLLSINFYKKFFSDIYGFLFFDNDFKGN